MSYTSIAKSTTDSALVERVRAAIAKEAYANEEFKATTTGQRILQSGPDPLLTQFVWAVAIANEAAYEYALGAANENPGGDVGVISDGAIESAIQANWPSDALVPPPAKYLKVISVSDLPTP